MKYIFLFIGILVGLFWSQIHQVVNMDLVNDMPGLSLRSSVDRANPHKVVPSKTPPKIKSETSAPVVTEVSQITKPNVVMYATSWCPYCKKAREYFHSNRIEYMEYDIEKSEQAKRMYDLVGGSGVPVILINGKKIQGFDKSKFESLYK